MSKILQFLLCLAAMSFVWMNIPLGPEIDAAVCIYALWRLINDR